MNIHETVFLAPGAAVIDQVEIGENSSVWYNAVIRGDDDTITIGKGSNIQDCAVLHGSEGYQVNVGDYVTVGHGVILHGCSIGDNTLIGMGSILLNGSRIGKNCVIGAGTLIPENMIVPDGSVCYGHPGKIIRQVTDKELKSNRHAAVEYMEQARKRKYDD